MTAPFSAPSSYWQTSRAPRYSLSFALPLLLFYQVLAVLLAHGTRSVRNGADVILQSLFVAVAGSWGPLVFMVCLIGVGLWLVARDLRKSSRLRATIFGGMLAEALLLALLFGFLVGGVTSGVLGGLQILARPAGGDLDRWTRLMLSLGAGIYEELLFRVLLVGALAAAARALLGWRPLTAGVAATLVGAAIFSAFHYIGPFGDRLQVYSFVFRMVAGLFFSALYLERRITCTCTCPWDRVSRLRISWTRSRPTPRVGSTTRSPISSYLPGRGAMPPSPSADDASIKSLHTFEARRPAIAPPVRVGRTKSDSRATSLVLVAVLLFPSA